MNEQFSKIISPFRRFKNHQYSEWKFLWITCTATPLALIEVPEKGFDFENQKDKKTIDEHLKPVANRVKKHWRHRRCFIDLQLIEPGERLKNGTHPVTFVFDQLRIENCNAVPVVGFLRDAAYLKSAFKAASLDRNGLCLRITIEQAANGNLKSEINRLFGNAFSARDADLILDLGAPNFLPLDGLGMLVETVVKNLPYLNSWRSFSVLGSSFPANMGEIKSETTTVTRNEWLLYKLFTRELAKAKIRIPAFGDYVINHPDVSQMDMRLVKPAGTLRYTVDDAWLIFKGPNVRDFGFSQYVKHCKKLSVSSDFLGAGFSAGDKYISDCASGKASTGNLSTWRKVGTNHHLEKVARDVASFSAVLNTV